MKSAVETLSPTRVKLTVEATAEELKPSMDAAFQAIAAQVQVPGFRKGKVPNRIIEQRVGRAAVLEEAVNDALPKLFGQAIQEHNVVPLGQPEVSDLEVPVEDSDPLKFTAEVDCRPTVELPDFSAIEVTVDPVTVPEGAVQDRLEELRARFGTLKTVERPAKDGDFVSIGLSATIDGEEIDTVSGVSYEVGSKNMLEGMDEAIIGLSAGESKTFTAPLAGGDHEGQDAECTVSLEAVKERELPEVDDDFAQLASEFDTLDELKADLGKASETEARYVQGLQARDKVLEHLRTNLDVPVPDALVEEEVTRHLAGENREGDEEHGNEVRDNTRQAMATQFVLDTVVERDNIQVEQPEFVEYLVMTAQQYGMQPNDFANMLSEQGQIPAVLAEVARRKALAGILEQVKVVDTEGNVVDMTAFGDEQDEQDGQPGEAQDEQQADAAQQASESSEEQSTPAEADKPTVADEESPTPTE